MAHNQTFNKFVLRLLLFSATAFGVTLAHVARADESTPPRSEPEAFTPLRYNEDYSYLRDPAARTNLFDPVKYIALGDGNYLTLGGQLRDRYEYFQNNTFGSGAQDHNGYNLIRGLLNADLHIDPYVRVFVQGISATEQDRVGGPRPTDEDEADLQQAFIELKIPLGSDSSLSLRGGRQIMVFGKERLIGVSDWTNVRRTYDGIRATWSMPGNVMDVFYANQVRVLPYNFDDDTPDTFIAGIYDTLQIPGDWAKQSQLQLETYAIHINRATNTFNTTSSGESRETLGARLSGMPKPFDFDLEPDYQFGRFKE
jgi:hypothetical protein